MALDLTQPGIASACADAITFLGERQAFATPLAWTTSPPDGTMHGVQIDFANGAPMGGGGDLVPDVTSVDLNLTAADKIGFFILRCATR